MCKCYQIPLTSLRVVSTPDNKKTNHHWLNHLQTLSHATLLAVGLNRSSQIPGVAKGNLGPTTFSHSSRLKPETKRKNLRFTQLPCFVQLHQDPKEELIYLVDKANKCD